MLNISTTDWYFMYRLTGNSKSRRWRRQIDVRSSTLKGFFRRIFFNFANFLNLLWEHCPDWVYTIKKWGWPCSIRRKRPFISLNDSVFIENLPSTESARAGAHAKKWWAERMHNAIEWNHPKDGASFYYCAYVRRIFGFLKEFAH